MKCNYFTSSFLGNEICIRLGLIFEKEMEFSLRKEIKKGILFPFFEKRIPCEEEILFFIEVFFSKKERWTLDVERFGHWTNRHTLDENKIMVFYLFFD